MIFVAMLGVVVALSAWFAELVNGWLASLPAIPPEWNLYGGEAAGYVGQVAHVVPVQFAGQCALALLALSGVCAAVGLVRRLVSLFTGGGGST